VNIIMRIVVASAYVPFRHDRNARLVTELTAMLRRRGHQAEAVLLPYQPTDADPVEQALGFRLLDLSECGGTPIDRLIALGEPAHALRHPHKTLWAVGSCRGKLEGLNRADAQYRCEARKIYYANQQANYSHGGEVLYPPLLDPTALRPADARTHFVWAGSMVANARPEFALEAMRFVRTTCSLVMMPEGLTSSQATALHQRIEEWDLGGRVELIPDAPPTERHECLRHALGCLSVGLNQEAPEDAIIEAFHARVPVLTVEDSGAPAWMIEHGVNGVKLEPSPRLLAVAMNRLAGEPSYRRDLGEGAFRLLEKLGVSWDHVAEALVA
jgi:glycosyltransferase involved in cell wall biosynthesis